MSPYAGLPMSSRIGPIKVRALPLGIAPEHSVLYFWDYFSVKNTKFGNRKLIHVLNTIILAAIAALYVAMYVMFSLSKVVQSVLTSFRDAAVVANIVRCVLICSNIMMVSSV